jgi:hypothetical protein
MRQLIGWLIVSSIVVLAPAIAAENASSPLDLKAPVSTQAAVNPPDAVVEIPMLLDFLDPSKNIRFTSNCPTPLECIAICESQGCYCTDGCDGMGGCLCSGCS